MREPHLFLTLIIKAGGDMSNNYVDYVMELIYQDLDSADEKGLLDEKIDQISKEHGLDADDDRDDIKVKIAEEVYEESFQ